MPSVPGVDTTSPQPAFFKMPHFCAETHLCRKIGKNFCGPGDGFRFESKAFRGHELLQKFLEARSLYVNNRECWNQGNLFFLYRVAPSRAAPINPAWPFRVDSIKY